MEKKHEIVKIPMFRRNDIFVNSLQNYHLKLFWLNGIMVLMCVLRILLNIIRLLY